MQGFAVGFARLVVLGCFGEAGEVFANLMQLALQELEFFE